MYEFECGSPVCNHRLTSSSKDELMREVAEHVRRTHGIAVPPKSILSYLDETAVTETSPTPKGRRKP
jgi:predicted small metal-binding protein